MSSISTITNALETEAKNIGITFSRTGPTTGTVTWTVPAAPIAYDGIVIVASPTEINPSNYPTDGVKYTGSTSLNAPADKIGAAQVVAALYGDRSTNSISLTGLDPDSVYFVSGHAVNNVRHYYNQGVRAYGPDDSRSEVFAGDMPKSYGPPPNPVVGQNYFDENQKMVFFWDGSAWKPTVANTVISGMFDPIPPFPTPTSSSAPSYPAGYPAAGDFFYNTQTKILKIWDGTKWNAAESVQGIPMYNKQVVGTTGQPSARANMIDILKKQMGYPVICVELTDDHWNIAINNALQELRRRVDSAYTKQYFFVQMQKYQDVYYLNDPSFGTDKIVDVLKIHRLNMMGLVNFAPDNIYAQQFLNQFYAPGVAYDLVSIHLIHAMSEIYSLLFAGEVAFNWREASRELRIYKKFGAPEKVLVETSCEKTEQELLVDRWTQQWIQQWAEGEAYMMLANIRGKFASLPGPGGGLQLNADAMRAEGQRLQEDCLRQVMDFEVGQNGPDNFFLPFVVG
jgi:hypothetical protein